MTEPLLTRLPDWEARLCVLLGERSSDQFAWGRNDCALFGADVVLALTGEDFGTMFRGKYEDAAGAAQALKDFGQGTIVKTFDATLTRVARGFARRGDLALTRCFASDDPLTRRLGSVGVVVGGEAVFVADQGLARRTRPDWTLCWRVGER